MINAIVRTRMAPSPTGSPHIGSIYNALFNKVWALKNDGTFVWRSEDTDRTRYVEGAEDAMNDALEWFNLLPDEDPFKGGPYSPYRQSERLDIYKKYASELVEKGHAYYCFCSKERLEEIKKQMIANNQTPMYDRHCLNLTKEELEKNLNEKMPHVIRLKIPKDTKIVCEDLIRGKIEFDSNTIDDQVLLKSDGYPTYHLAVVVDDHLMKISHVIRGHEWISSFPKQKLLHDMLGFKIPVYVHFPSLLNMDRAGKLSKRYSNASVNWYRVKGYLPEAILNFIALLGWSHPEEKEIFNFDEFIGVFDIKDISANLPKFDLTKLDWMNGEYIRLLSDGDLLLKINEWLEFNKAENASLKNFLDSLDNNKKLLFVQINKERIKKFEDLIPLNEFFYFDPENFDNKSIFNQMVKYRKIAEIRDHLEWVRGIVSDRDGDETVGYDSSWTLENLKKVESKIKDRAAEINWKILEVFYPIRIAITGKPISPPLFESIYILGREKTLERLDNAIKNAL